MGKGYHWSFKESNTWVNGYQWSWKSITRGLTVITEVETNNITQVATVSNIINPSNHTKVVINTILNLASYQTLSSV